MLGVDLLPVVYPAMFDETDYIDQDPFDAAADFGYDNTVFLENSNEELVTWLIVIFMWPAFKILTYCKN